MRCDWLGCCTGDLLRSEAAADVNGIRKLAIESHESETEDVLRDNPALRDSFTLASRVRPSTNTSRVNHTTSHRKAVRICFRPPLELYSELRF